MQQLWLTSSAKLVLGGGDVGVGGCVVGEVKKFCCLRDVLDCGGFAERAIRARVGAAWGKWKEILSLLVN